MAYIMMPVMWAFALITWEVWLNPFKKEKARGDNGPDFLTDGPFNDM